MQWYEKKMESAHLESHFKKTTHRDCSEQK